MSQNRFIRRARRQKSTSEDYQKTLAKASLAHREGRLFDAEKGYLKVLKFKPAWGQLLNALGTVYLDQKKADKAKMYFAKAADLTPPNIAACYNLGRMKQQENDHLGALSIYEKLLRDQPDSGEAWNNAGIAYKATGNRQAAMQCFEKAVAFAPEMAEAWNNLGVAQDEQRLFSAAADSYLNAINCRPDYSSAHFNLGCSLQKLGKFDEARQHYEKVLELNPGDSAAKFMFQSITTASDIPEAAPAEHVRRIFDQCADTFERILVEDLEYRTPELLFQLVHPHLSGDMNILDLGCGTGLGARFYKPFAKMFTGVDISSKMLEQAAAKNVYDRLETFDISKEWPMMQQFDLIYSSDVFVYIGNLDKILGVICSHLANGGHLAFSVEKLDEEKDKYRLFPSGRYAHRKDYVETSLEQHGLKIIEMTESIIRKESGIHVQGLLIIASKAEQ